MNNSDLLIYKNQDSTIKIDVRLKNDTVWLTQAQLAELFAKSKKTISEHSNNIFDEGELIKEVVVQNFQATTQHGVIEGKLIEFSTCKEILQVQQKSSPQVKKKLTFSLNNTKKPPKDAPK